MDLQRTDDYKLLLQTLKERVAQAQYQALKAVNKELIELYWDVGRIIVEKQAELGWGKSVVDKLAKDLQLEFPGVRGFSSQNLWRMRLFYEIYKESANLSALLREISWTHHLEILGCKSQEEREFYLKMTRKHGWS